MAHAEKYSRRLFGLTETCILPGFHGNLFLELGATANVSHYNIPWEFKPNVISRHEIVSQRIEQNRILWILLDRQSHYTLGHIGVFLTEFSRKAIISQYCYSSLAAVNQDNHLNIIPGNLSDPFRILHHLFFIQSDILQNHFSFVVLVLYSVVIMPTLCCMVKIMSETAFDCKNVQFLILIYLISSYIICNDSRYKIQIYSLENPKRISKMQEQLQKKVKEQQRK